MTFFTKFVHLQVYSEATFDYGIIRLKNYIDFALKNKINILSLTDKYNLFSSLKFYSSCIGYGIKPIIGCEIIVDSCLHDDRYSKFLLLCKNYVGYKNLLKLVSKSYSEDFLSSTPIIKTAWLISLSEGLIAIGLGVESDIGISLLNGNITEAKVFSNFWKSVFVDSFYLSVSRTNMENEDLYIDLILNSYSDINLPLVAVNGVYYLSESDLLASILKDSVNATFIVDADYTDSFLRDRYFKNFDQMFVLFKEIPEVLFNSFEIAKCCNVFLNTSDKKNLYCDKYSSVSENLLFDISLDNVFEFLGVVDQFNTEFYVNRLKNELDIVNLTGYAKYFLITSNLIRLAYEVDVLVGPARGSGAGSFLASSLGITGVDPFEHGLLFERFLNKERVSSPDFDVDLCIDSRDFFINYVIDYYSIELVAQISTFAIMSSIAVLKDIGRSLGYSYFFVDKIIKLIPNKVNVLLKFEYENNKDFLNCYNGSIDVKKIIDLGMKLEGLYKNVGKHAGGVVISYRNLVEDTSLYYTYDDNHFVTQYDKDDIEKLGLIKFDFLGLKTLSILEVVNSFLETYIDFIDYSLFSYEDISLENDNVFYMFSESETIGVFQLESKGIRKVLGLLKPSLISEINALLALYRPGPLKSGMVDDFVNRKLGIEKIYYPHELLAKVLGETYGVIVYQEQVMKIAQELANYSLGLADLLRVSISKKKEREMDLHLERFTLGCLKNNINSSQSKEIFDLLEKFAGYGFNKAHSVGYGTLTYNTAWLKANYYPLYLVILLSSDMEDVEKMKSYISDCRNFGLEILLPDINKSFFCFTLEKKKIRFGFGAIKGLGENIVIEIIENRNYFGDFKSFYDFLYRISFVDITKQILNSLINSGCFDSFEYNRNELLKISSLLSKYLGKVDINSINYFNFCCSISSTEFLSLVMKKNRIWRRLAEFNLEKKILCDYISSHPIKYYKNELYDIITTTIYDLLQILNQQESNEDIVCGLILSINFVNTANTRLILIFIYDLSEAIEVVIDLSKFEMCKKFIFKDEIIISKGRFKNSRLFANSIYTLIDFRSKFVKFMFVFVYKKSMFLNLMKNLEKVFSRDISLGRCFLKIIFCDDNNHIDLSNKWNFFPTDVILCKIVKISCVYKASYIY